MQASRHGGRCCGDDPTCLSSHPRKHPWGRVGRPCCWAAHGYSSYCCFCGCSLLHHVLQHSMSTSRWDGLLSMRFKVCFCVGGWVCMTSAVYVFLGQGQRRMHQWYFTIVQEHPPHHNHPYSASHTAATPPRTQAPFVPVCGRQQWMANWVQSLRSPRWS